jgi:hypothetical protein
MDKSYLTAISRKNITKPMQWLIKHGYIKGGRGLDFGCGKSIDADVLGWEKYDPYYQPILPKGQFDVVSATYVLNVLKPIDRVKALKTIAKLLKDNGTAYLTVRRDIIKQGCTKKGTYQVNVIYNFKVIKANNGFCIYMATKADIDKHLADL